MPRYEYVPDPKLQALAAQSRESRIQEVVDQGISRQLAESHIDKLDQCLDRAFEKMMMETGTGKGAFNA